MRETPEARPGDDPRPAADDRIAWLLRLAGPRPAAPAEHAERVRQAVRDAWREEMTRRRRRRRRRWAAAVTLPVAAALAVAVLLTGRGDPESAVQPETAAPPVEVAQVEALAGRVHRALPGDDVAVGALLVAGETLTSGTALTTAGDGRAALRLASGPSLRLDVGTRVRLVTATVLSLERGAVYVDSGRSADDPGPAVEVRTGLGVVRDVGTQFEVRLDAADSRVRVRVREGRIHLDRGDRSWRADAGAELRVASDGSLHRGEVPLSGPEWAWILRVSPPFALDGSRLDTFLGWVVRETGWQLAFADRRIADQAPEITLHGTIDELRPDQALDAVLPTCGLRYRIDGDRLVIDEEEA